MSVVPLCTRISGNYYYDDLGGGWRQGYLTIAASAGGGRSLFRRLFMGNEERKRERERDTKRERERGTWPRKESRRVALDRTLLDGTAI